jgi:hypothetical protein
MVHGLLSTTRMRIATLGLVGLFVLAVACGDDDDDGGDADAAVGPDASASFDAPVGTPDAPVGTPDGSADTDGGGDDGGIIITDGGVVTDGGTTIPALCAALCDHIAVCFDEDDVADCVAECSADLSGCNGGELDDLSVCAGIDCEVFEECVLSVGCIGVGKGGCGDGFCEAGEEKTCPEDCFKEEFCGDGVCSELEDCAFCAEDCGACVCGDGVCAPGECSSCGADCPGGCICPHDVCSLGELLDPGCDSCVVDICDVDPYCCTVGWDGICVGEAESICGKECPAICGDFICDAGEESTCPDDCFMGKDPPPDEPPPDEP